MCINLFNSLPHNHDLMTLYMKPFKNIKGEKEKMLVTSTFSFSNNVFYTSLDEFQFMSHGLNLKALNKPITQYYPEKYDQNNCTFIVLLSTEFHQSGTCRCKIRLHILCSLILIYTGCKSNYSCDRHC